MNKIIITLLMACQASMALQAMQKVQQLSIQQKATIVKETIHKKVAQYKAGSPNQAKLQQWEHREQWIKAIEEHDLAACVIQGPGKNQKLDENRLDELISDAEQAYAVRADIAAEIDKLNAISDDATKKRWEIALSCSKEFALDKEIIECGLDLEKWEKIIQAWSEEVQNNEDYLYAYKPKTRTLRHAETMNRENVQEEAHLEETRKRLLQKQQEYLEQYEKIYFACKQQGEILDQLLVKIWNKLKAIERATATSDKAPAIAIMNERNALAEVIEAEDKAHAALKADFNKTVTPDMLYDFIAQEKGKIPHFPMLKDRREALKYVIEKLAEIQAKHPDIDAITVPAQPEREMKADFAQGQGSASSTSSSQPAQANGERKRRVDAANGDARSSSSAEPFDQSSGLKAADRAAEAAEAARKAASKAAYDAAIANYSAAKTNFIKEFKKVVKTDLVKRAKARLKLKNLTIDQLKAIDEDIDALDIPARLYDEFIKQEHYKKAATGNIITRWWNRKKIQEAIAADRRDFHRHCFEIFSETAFGDLNDSLRTGQLYALAEYANKGYFMRFVTSKKFKRVTLVGAIAAIGAYVWYKQTTSR